VEQVAAVALPQETVEQILVVAAVVKVQVITQLVVQAVLELLLLDTLARNAERVEVFLQRVDLHITHLQVTEHIRHNYGSFCKT
jgi:hypothetical protein